MSILIGGFLVFFGVLWTGILLAVHFARPAAVPAEAAVPLQIMTAVGAVVLAIGVLLLVTGLVRARKLREKALKIFRRGTEAKGKVTFVDKNYGLLVNNKPIYSIIEFTFQDAAGRVYTARKANVESDLVIRCGIQVGSEVDLKYLPENPGDNVLLIKDPSAA